MYVHDPTADNRWSGVTILCQTKILIGKLLENDLSHSHPLNNDKLCTHSGRSVAAMPLYATISHLQDLTGFSGVQPDIIIAILEHANDNPKPPWLP